MFLERLQALYKLSEMLVPNFSFSYTVAHFSYYYLHQKVMTVSN